MAQLYRFGLLLCFILLSGVVGAKTVRLITIGPGDAFWSAFGHTAIAIDHDVYGFGYFSFEDDVITEFIENRMEYELGLSVLNHELWLAKQQNRDFSAVSLNLKPNEINELEDFLQWHNLPENQAYRYDYFLNNCSTIVRDLINQAFDEALYAPSQMMAGSNYFQQTVPAKHQALMNLGLAMGYGWSAYQSRTVWELMAFPVFLEDRLIELLPQKTNHPEVYFTAELESAVVSWLKTHWALLAYVLFWVFLLSLRFRAKVACIYLYWHGLIGCVLLALWLLTPHQAGDWNFNVLLFSPLGFLVHKWQTVSKILFISWVTWLVLALYLGAWYLLVLLLLNFRVLVVLNKISSGRGKSGLTFGGVR